MVTFPQLIDAAEARIRAVRRQADADVEAAESAAAAAKRRAADARRRSTAEPASSDARAAVPDAEQAATDAGRKVPRTREAGQRAVSEAVDALTMWRFEAAVDDWVTRVACAPGGEAAIDPTLWALAAGDEYLAAGYHLRAAGVSVPAGWRSPSGVTLNAIHSSQHDDPASDSRGAAAAQG